MNIQSCAHANCDIQKYRGSSVAVCLARLGLRVAWASRLPDNALGQRIAQTLEGQGVDVSNVVWTTTGRAGTYFAEFGQPPRPTTVTYDRRGSAMSEMALGHVRPKLLDQSRLLQLTGITPALSPS